MNSLKKPVYRINNDGTKTRFESVADAAEQHKGQDWKSNISRACRRGITHDGFYWEYASETSHITQLPNILLLDIETAPMVVYSWTLFKPRLSHDNIVEDWFMLSWAGKWLHSSEVMSDVVTPKEAVRRNDRRICDSLYELMDKADVIIAHNAKKFDIRKINSRFLTHGIQCPSPYQVVDTLCESRRYFAHSSHRLDYLGRLLEREEKLETNFQLWINCMAGDQEALTYMDTYCKQDILLLQKVYLHIRGWIKSHPNMALLVEAKETICPVCGSNDIEFCSDYVTVGSVFNGYRCNNCKGVSRGRKSKLSIRDREKLIISAAR
jgi:hypothetical protein